MISIMKTALEQERREKLKITALNCYRHALSSSDEQAIEIDPVQASNFRSGLRMLISQCDETASPEQLIHVQSLFAKELQDYREKVHEQLRLLRRNLDATALALEEFAGNNAASGDDHEKELRQGLSRLDTALASNEVEELRAAIRSASGSILASFEQMRALNQLAIAQLKDEIRVLHQRIQPEGRSRAPGSDAGTLSRCDINDRIEELLRADASFCLVLVVFRNWKLLAIRNSGVVMKGALESLQARLRRILGESSTVGYWNTNQFVAILDVAPSAAMALSRDIAKKLMEPYDFLEDGTRRSLTFQVAGGVVDHRAGADATKFRAGMEKLSAALRGGA